MKIVIAPDKFKGTLTAWEVADIIESSINKLYDDIEVVKLPMADGGDGTAELFLRYGGTKFTTSTFDARMNPIEGEYVVYKDYVVVEMSQSVGMARLTEEQLDPTLTSSYGFGRVIREIIERGYRNIVLGIGGSATNDCGIGLLSALGARFFDSNGERLSPIGANLSKIASFDTTELEAVIAGCNFRVACDVNNPLYGDNGATYTYAPQKGATAAQLVELEASVVSFASLYEAIRGVDMNRVVGGGAAGGVGAALATIVGATLLSGAELVADLVDLESNLLGADLLITGEGRVDNQTMQGKLVDVVYNIAKRNDCSVVAYCGVSTVDSRSLPFSVVSVVESCSIDSVQAMSNPRYWLECCVTNTIREYAIK